MVTNLFGCGIVNKRSTSTWLSGPRSLVPRQAVITIYRHLALDKMKTTLHLGLNYIVFLTPNSICCNISIFYCNVRTFKLLKQRRLDCLYYYYSCFLNYLRHIKPIYCVEIFALNIKFCLKYIH